MMRVWVMKRSSLDTSRPEVKMKRRRWKLLKTFASQMVFVFELCLVDRLSALRFAYAFPFPRHARCSAHTRPLCTPAFNLARYAISARCTFLAMI